MNKDTKTKGGKNKMNKDSKQLEQYRELLNCIEGAYKSLSDGTDSSDNDSPDCVDNAFAYLKEAKGRVSGLIFDEIEKNKKEGL